MNQTMPPVLFQEFYDTIFLKIVHKAILGMFKKHIRDNYRVSDFAQLSSDKWIVRLERTGESYMREKKDGNQTDN